ncbi:MAG: 50S ribosomal protein L10 [Candidatus Omnitrophota bacterium]
MKKLGLIFKETQEQLIKDSLKESACVFIIKYSGLSSPDLSSLRSGLKACDANLFVVKNTVARRAFKGQTVESLIKAIEGPCGLVFTRDEPVGASRVLYKFSKEHEALKLEGGFMSEGLLEKKDIELLAKLPGKEVLRAQVAAALNAPITGLVGVLSQVLRKFVFCLEQIKNKKGS